MGILDRLFNRGKTSPPDPQRQNLFFPYRHVIQDLRLSPDEALSVSAVWACVRIIAESLSSSPWNVYSRDEAGRKVLLKDDSVHWLLNNRPNPEMTAQSFREVLMFQTLISGNGYAEIVKDLAGRVVELWPLISDRVIPRRLTDGTLRYEYSDDNGQLKYLDPEFVFHLRGPSVSGFLGDSIITRAARAAALAAATERFATGFYSNGASVGGTLKTTRILTPDQERQLREDWKAGQGGVGNAFRTAILPPGMEYQPANVNSQESEVVATRNLQVEDILRFFGVPGHLAGFAASSQGYGRNLSDLFNSFVRMTLTPWTKRLEQEADAKLFGVRSPKQSCIELGWLTRGDEMQRAQANEVLRRNGVISANEWRESEGLNVSDDEMADELMVGGGLIPMESAGSTSPSMPSEPTDTQDQEETMDTEDDTSEGAPTIENLHRLILTNHSQRLKARFEDLSKVLKNGQLHDKLEQARDWSRQRADADLSRAGIQAPAGWAEALVAVEDGSDPAEIARSLNRRPN